MAGLKQSPIDYAATRKAIVAALSQATGLETTRIIRAQGAGPVQPPPPRPYCSFQYRTVAMRSGQDAITAAPDIGPTMWRVSGERGISIDFNFYADDQDTAYSLALLWQIGLSQQPIRELLEASDLSVWDVGDATDVTALLGTGFEARAFLECEMWLGVTVIVDLSSMDSVTALGTVLTQDDLTALQISTTVQTAKGV